MGIKRVDNLGFYLGLPLMHDRLTIGTFDFILSKVRQKLSGWNARKHSLAGCITLARSVLFSIPNYFMFTIRVPVFMCLKIEKIAKSFI